MGIYTLSHIDQDAEDGVLAVKTTWKELVDMLEKGEVKRIVLTDDLTMARIYLKEGKEGSHEVLQAREEFNYADAAITRTSIDFGKAKPDESLPSNRDVTFHYNGIESPMASISQAGSTQSAYLRPILKLPVDYSFESKIEHVQRQAGIRRGEFVAVQYSNTITESSPILKAGARLAFLGIVAGLVQLVLKRPGGSKSLPAGGGGSGSGVMAQFGKSNAKQFSSKDVKINFDSVAGCIEAKREIVEFVDFLKDASRFTKLGAKIPKGALLCGPPGTGKTLLAKAVAGEAGVPFYSVSGSDFVEMFVGVGPSRVRDLFKEARAAAPCIIFIDEIDAIGRKRGNSAFAGGSDERENTLNQLLVEMDGFNPSSGVVVLAGTNRPDILDDALTRPGRFDRQVFVGLPDLQGRKEIFEVHLKTITLGGASLDIARRLAWLTPGFSGADIANLCNEAAIVAARRGADTVALQDFEAATDRVIGGLQSSKQLSEVERDVVAHHEAGHAVVGWFLEHTDPVVKITITPRGSGTLGYSHHLPNELSIRTEEQIMDMVCTALAGRAAEHHFFGQVTTGASDDLQKATELVLGMIQRYGFNKSVGQLVLANESGVRRPFSSETAGTIDREARATVDRAYARTLSIIEERREEVKAVARMLLKKDSVTHDDLACVLGDRQHSHRPNSAYLRSKDPFEEEKEVEEEMEEGTEEGHGSDPISAPAACCPMTGFSFAPLSDLTKR